MTAVHSVVGERHRGGWCSNKFPRYSISPQQYKLANDSECDPLEFVPRGPIPMLRTIAGQFNYAVLFDSNKRLFDFTARKEQSFLELPSRF